MFFPFVLIQMLMMLLLLLLPLINSESMRSCTTYGKEITESGIQSIKPRKRDRRLFFVLKSKKQKSEKAKKPKAKSKKQKAPGHEAKSKKHWGGAGGAGKLDSTEAARDQLRKFPGWAATRA